MLKSAFSRKGLSSQVIGPAILQSSPSMLCMLLVAVKVPLKKRVCPCDPPWVGLSSVSSRSARATDAESMIPAINIIKKRVCNFRFISIFPFKVDFDCSAQHPLGLPTKTGNAPSASIRTFSGIEQFRSVYWFTKGGLREGTNGLFLCFRNVLWA